MSDAADAAVLVVVATDEADVVVALVALESATSVVESVAVPDVASLVETGVVVEDELSVVEVLVPAVVESVVVASVVEEPPVLTSGVSDCTWSPVAVSFSTLMAGRSRAAHTLKTTHTESMLAITVRRLRLL